ncbi:hypothetical protein RYH73_26005 [Olivibacter sp. CPCC 100613]|uniref:hypothetical protein n=1 Tax=Olivibacter sp. CPCC 100613 TaxID=3079931 RepID=UPI002FFC2445
MAIRKERRLSPLRDKPFKKKEEKRLKKEDKHIDPDSSYEGGIDPQRDQLNDVPKKVEDRQNTDEKNKLK